MWLIKILAEAFTAGLIVVVDKLTSFIFTTIAGPMTDKDLFYPILYMLAGLLLVAFILMLFVEGNEWFEFNELI